MNKNLSLLPIDLNNILAGRVVATGIINGASLKADDCVIDSITAGWALVGTVNCSFSSHFARGLVMVYGDHLMMSGHARMNGRRVLSLMTDAICCLSIKIGKKKGIRVVAPMLGAKYNNVFYKRVLTLKEMNSPYQKSFLKKCFPEEFEKIGMTKTKQLSFQVGGRLEDFFAPIVHDPQINYKNYKTGDVKKTLQHLAILHYKEAHGTE